MIRIRHPGGTSTFNVADGAAPLLRDLQAFIQEQSGIPPQHQERESPRVMNHNTAWIHRV